MDRQQERIAGVTCPGRGVARVHALVRDAVPHVSEDREFAVDIGRVAAMIASGRFSGVET
jgi:histidine ammonia-lyase